MDTMLLLARFVHLFALSVLFGAACYPSYGLPNSSSGAYERLPWLRRLLLGAALLTLVSGIAWLAVLSAGASGRWLDVSGAAILSTIRDANFGWVWPLRLALSAGLVLSLLAKRAPTVRLKLVIGGSLVLLASIALTGNAADNEGPTGFQHRLMDAVHLVASGVWIGALVVFALLANRSVRHLRADELPIFLYGLHRFSGIGTIAVATLTLSGMLNPGFFMSSLGTPYGQVLLVKLALFVMMLALAALNRFWLTPRLSREMESAGRVEIALSALRASIAAETALGVLVLALVAWLGILPAPT